MNENWLALLAIVFLVALLFYGFHRVQILETGQFAITCWSWWGSPRAPVRVLKPGMNILRPFETILCRWDAGVNGHRVLRPIKLHHEYCVVKLDVMVRVQVKNVLLFYERTHGSPEKLDAMMREFVIDKAAIIMSKLPEKTCANEHELSNSLEAKLTSCFEKEYSELMGTQVSIRRLALQSKTKSVAYQKELLEQELAVMRRRHEELINILVIASNSSKDVLDAFVALRTAELNYHALMDNPECRQE